MHKEKCAGAWDCPKRVKDINEYAGYNLTEEFYFLSIGPMMIISFLNGILLFGLKGRNTYRKLISKNKPDLEFGCWMNFGHIIVLMPTR